jgi:TonB family protein
MGIRFPLLLGGLVGWWLMAAPAVAQPAGEERVGPRVVEAAAPVIPIQAIRGGEVVLEVAVDATGSVSGARTLRGETPFEEAMSAAALGWRFAPGFGIEEDVPVELPGHVLLVAIFRPPALFDFAVGPPRRTAEPPAPSPDVPGVGGALAIPPYPPTALGDATVIVEIELGRDGRPLEHRLVRSAPGFDESALDAVRKWRFTAPATDEPADLLYAYAVLVFREPVVQ